MKYKSIIMLCILADFAHAQEISGKIVDRKKEPITYASVQVYKQGVLKGKAIADFDGDYVVKPLDTGTYDVVLSYTGTVSKRITNVVVANNVVKINERLLPPDSTGKNEITIEWKPQIITNKPGNGDVIKKIGGEPNAELVALPQCTTLFIRSRNTVHGNVITANGTAIAGARVRMYQMGKQLGNTLSDSSGFFWVLAPGASEYKVTVKKRGYKKTTYTYSASNNDPVRIVVIKKQGAPTDAFTTD